MNPGGAKALRGASDGSQSVVLRGATRAETHLLEHRYVKQHHALENSPHADHFGHSAFLFLMARSAVVPCTLSSNFMTGKDDLSVLSRGSPPVMIWQCGNVANADLDKCHCGRI
jgi:hypothetical protein